LPGFLGDFCCVPAVRNRSSVTASASKQQ
jgi:hypothetical protein